MAKQDPLEFGEYHLLEKIATGGMAEVWRARAYGMAGFEKILVIKKVLPELVKDAEFIRLFIDEARISVQLLHVNIVQVFDLGQVDGSYYMAMEYVHGLDLARLISRAKGRGPFPTDMLRRDQCWPATSDDATRIARSCNPDGWGYTEITLATALPDWRVNWQRWKSFGWTAYVVGPLGQEAPMEPVMSGV